jgi:hypothetical protein
MRRYLGLNWKFLTFLEIETMNKFEALKQFMAWPPEWQRLCAEYWIETGEGEDRPAVQVWTTADKVQAAGELVQRGVTLPMPGDPWPFDQPKAAAKVAAAPSNYRIMDEGEMKLRAILAKPTPARNFMRYTRDELTEVDSHVSEGRGPSEVARIMDKKYPRQRTIDAWEKMANRIKKVGLQAMLDRAVDVEFK